MDNVRNEVTSSVASRKISGIRDETLIGVTPYQNGKKMFERANGFKAINFDGNVSSVDSMCHGRVRDRKKFFEHHIIEQQQRENALISPTPPSYVSDSAGRSVIEERTDSESFSRNKSDKFERERITSKGMAQNKSDGIGTTNSISTKEWESGFDSGWDAEPEEFFEQEPSHDFTKEKGSQAQETLNENKLRSTNGTIDTSGNYTEKVKSIDAEILYTSNNCNTETEVKEKESQPFPRGERREGIEQTGKMPRRSEGHEETKDLARIKTKPACPSVKIQVTKTRIENQNLKKNSELKFDVDEMVTEFQQVSEKLSEELTSNSSPENIVTGCISSDRKQPTETISDDEHSLVETRPDTRSTDENFESNTLTANDFNELAEKLHANKRKETAPAYIYVCPSESTDYSIDSKGNSKGTKSISSKSAMSSIILKVKSNGMSKMLKKAKKGMGKSVKNLTSVVKNTMKTRPSKQSLTSTEKAMDGISDHKDCIKLDDIFHEKLAQGLVEESKDTVGIIKASQYLDAGNRLLRRNVELKRAKDPRKAKETIQKAHTYAYVGRQLAKQFLMACRQEHLKDPREDLMTWNSSGNDDDIFALEEFFISFMQCVGPCARDDAIEQSRLQVDDALEILSSLSEEEESVVKNQSSKEIIINKRVVSDRKMIVEKAIADIRDSAHKDLLVNQKERAYRERSMAIHSFVEALRSFYEVDNTMALSPIFSKFTNDQFDDVSDSSRSFVSEGLSYNYSEALKFDYGRSIRTHSNTSAPRGGPTSKEESLAEGIHPGTTVVSISVKNRNFKKKKQMSSKKWGRKQK